MGTQSITHPPRRLTAPLRSLLFLLALTTLPAPAQTPIQTPATTISLLLPSAIVFDPTGNLYLAETANHVIRKVDTAGIITTIAGTGTGTQGFSGDSGLATAAQLDSPQGLALDTNQNLYIADTHNHRIRKLNLATGIITTIAGTTAGFSGDSGPATAAHLNLPTALAIDANQNLYIADTQNHRIRRIDAATGTITTVAGNGIQGFSGDSGPATTAAIDSPTGLALDPARNLYLADTHNHRIRRIDSITGIITTIAGTGAEAFTGDNAAAQAATLALPHGLTLDAGGNLYLADTLNHRIRRIDAATGTITTIAGDGTQTFSGDFNPATAASLDTPRTTALSPATLLTLADTGNQRIRQIATDATLHTIAGLAPAAPGALAFTAPTVIPYGTGQITASVTFNNPSGTPPPTGTLTFLDISTPTGTTLGTATLSNNTATLNTATLSAGLHTLIATYAGDQTHPAAQSPIFTLTVTPQPLIATPNSVALLYGQPILPLTGTLTGLLSQDSSTVQPTFTTPATTLSPAAIYPIAAAITGPAAGNYTLTTTPATVIIAPAPTIITLGTTLASAASISPGDSVTVVIHVASTTSGTPAGTITLLDEPTALLTAAISPAGDATYTTRSLSPGSHTFTALYNGSPNFNSSASTPASITVITGPPDTPGTPDFTLTPTAPRTQTILSGAATNFSFTVQTQGNLASPITLAASGLPNLATASFNPAYLPPGSTPITFSLTIATPKTVATNDYRIRSSTRSTTWAFLLLPIAGLTLRLRKHQRLKSLLLIALLALTLPLATACGDRIGSNAQITNPPKTYTVTVTGTATSPTGSTLTHATTVTLLLQPAA